MLHEEWKRLGRQQGANDIIARLRGKVSPLLLAETLEEFRRDNPLPRLAMPTHNPETRKEIGKPL